MISKIEYIHKEEQTMEHSLIRYLERLSVEDLQIALLYYQSCDFSDENERMIKKILEIMNEHYSNGKKK